MSILSLPPELFEEILRCIPTQLERQQATLQLTRALPRAPIPLQHLFHVVRLPEAFQVVSLDRRIRRGRGGRWFGLGDDDGGDGDDGDDCGDGCASMIRSLHVDAFDADAEVVLNLLSMLHDVVYLRLCVGPTFLPEHLQSALVTPRKTLRKLELRFLPYVKKANYLPFLKGSYYDSALSELARWPAPSTTSSSGSSPSQPGLQFLSIIQEPLPSTSLHPDDVLAKTKGKFAQPIVFFSFRPLAELVASPAMSSLSSLCVRIPGRDVSPHLFVPLSSSLPASSSSSARRIRLLDLSTTDVTLRALERLLPRLPRLTHLVLDNTNIVPKGEPHAVEESWRALGKACAVTGGARAKEVEKDINEWIATRAAEAAGGGDDEVTVNGNRGGAAAGDANGRGGAVQQRAQKKGRRGVAISTISLRGVSSSSSSAPTSSSSNPQPHLPFSIPSLASLPSFNAHKTKVRVTSSPPTLTSLCISLPSSSGRSSEEGNEEEVTNARKLLKEGWEEGIALMRVRWGRLRSTLLTSTAFSSAGSRTSSSNTLVLAFNETSTEDDEERLIPTTIETLDRLLEREFACPLLCFAGDADDAKEGRHVEGCGHLFEKGESP